MFTAVLLWEDRWVACRGHVYFSVVVGRRWVACRGHVYFSVVGRQVGGM